MGDKSQRDRTIFKGGVEENVNLAIGGEISWMKWLKNEAGKGFIYYAITFALFYF